MEDLFDKECPVGLRAQMARERRDLHMIWLEE
jgi:hypothetical protein